MDEIDTLSTLQTSNSRLALTRFLSRKMRFRFCISHALLTDYDLEKTIALTGDIAGRVRMDGRFPSRHQRPTVMFEVRGQPGFRHRRQSQCSVRIAPIYVV
jgi:hypothetical protein